MKFSPCISGKCTYEGSRSEGCGRTHEEIAETKKVDNGISQLRSNEEI